MQKVTPELVAHLRTGATKMCRCWRITRTDGHAMGFTDHDRDLSFDGTLFSASSGLDAGAIELSTGLSVDNSQAVGALSSIGLTETDIQTGKYDGAKVELWLVNWTNVGLRKRQFVGSIGEIRREGAVFEAELRGLAEPMNRPVGRAYLQKCSAILGDRTCGVDLTDLTYRTEVQVEIFIGRRVLKFSDLSGFAARWFLGGQIEWLSGGNLGSKNTITTDEMQGHLRVLEIAEETSFDVAEGDLLRLTPGCDKVLGTCRDKFDNLLQFRGFPQMPGEDWVTAYPNEGGSYDGGSLFNDR